MTDASTAALADAAHSRHVVVIGGGLAGLIAALECAKVGLRVTVAEESDAFGGTIRAAELAGVVVDVGATGFSPRGGAVRTIAEELGLTVVRSSELTPWIVGAGSVAAPLPEATLLGIPENPWDESVRRLIGWRGAWRAYVDRLRPPLTIGTQRSLGALVRSRMGERVLERLVAPLSLATYGTHPDDIDVEIAAPGLSTALTRTGSLAGAVAQLRGEAPPRPRLETVAGGMALLVEALCGRLVELGVDLRLQTRIEALAPRDGGEWDLVVTASRDTTPSIDPADAVIVATPESAARFLLAPHVPALDAEIEPPAVVDIVTLLVDAPALTDRPRGDAVRAVPGSHRATGVVVASLRWPDLASRLAPGQQLLHVSFGTRAEAPDSGASDEEAVRLAVAESESLLGTPLVLVAGRRDRFDAAIPGSLLGHRDAAHAVRSAVGAVAGLAVTGAWVSGSGLAQVLPDAAATAERVRSSLLWGGAPSPPQP